MLGAGGRLDKSCGVRNSLVPKLSKDATSVVVNRFGHLAPCPSLLFVVDAWHSIPPLRFLTDPGSLSDDQPGAGALRVLLDHQVVWYMPVIFRPHPGLSPVCQRSAFPSPPLCIAKRFGN